MDRLFECYPSSWEFRKLAKHMPSFSLIRASPPTTFRVRDVLATTEFAFREMNHRWSRRQSKTVCLEFIDCSTSIDVHRPKKTDRVCVCVDQEAYRITLRCIVWGWWAERWLHYPLGANVNSDHGNSERESLPRVRREREREIYIYREREIER